MSAQRPPLFDVHAVKAARRRAARIGGERFLEVAALEGLADRLSPVKRHFTHGLWIGEALPGIVRPFAEHWSLTDFSDEEILDAGEARFDLALSLYTLQSLNDLPGALIQIRRALKPDGLFLAALFAGATLQELRECFAVAESEIKGGISPRVAPFGDVRDMGSLLQRAGFALPVSDVERLSVRYGDLEALVGDLRAHGQTNVLAARPKHFLNRRVFAALRSGYAARHGRDGKLTATFETVFLTGWSPHESQQKPLKPGSAKTRLSDALGTVERKL
ncbi:MAG TPA: methyltransferase domain-containing protein [Rhizomicrobium sp.]|jgi:SAM-dependent methyltransferase|nr:methyltransferase domain-containing protein [Rhizomicrobium sp.]